MAEIVRMPKMSDTMTEGVIAKWHKKIGDTVKSGELMAEIETDKATIRVKITKLYWRAPEKRVLTEGNHQILRVNSKLKKVNQKRINHRRLIRLKKLLQR